MGFLMNKETLIEKAADLLWTAQQTNTPCNPIIQLFNGELSIDDAYNIQMRNINRMVAQGHRIIGKKIGLTSPVVQKQLGVDQPDFGHLFSDMVYAEGEGIPLTRLIQPKVEAEIALVLKKDLPHKDTTLIELMNAVDYVLPALEIVDSRVKNWQIKIQDTVADNASSALLCIGQQPVRLQDCDLIKAQMSMTRDGEVVSSGQGSACLGNPLVATLWLARTMAKMGSPLQAGEIILTGALGAMAPITQPCVVQADISGVGSIKAEFVAV